MRFIAALLTVLIFAASPRGMVAEMRIAGPADAGPADGAADAAQPADGGVDAVVPCMRTEQKKQNGNAKQLAFNMKKIKAMLRNNKGEHSGTAKPGND